MEHNKRQWNNANDGTIKYNKTIKQLKHTTIKQWNNGTIKR